jgi:hypothetical protein
MPHLVVSRLSGGLGNQLFQYAAACGIARRSGGAVGLDVSSFDEIDDGCRYLLGRYELPVRMLRGTHFDPHYRTATIADAAPSTRASTPLRLPVYRENNYQFEPATAALDGDAYLYGFWQSWKYFDHVGDELRARIRGDDHATEDAAVAVHVRRGDYLVPDVLEAFGLCEMDYYGAAMDLLRQRVPRPRFLVFSDDPSRCRRHFTDRDATVVSDPASDVYADLARMAQCRHHILANSSLSWWGAWLAGRKDAICVAPIPWYTQSPHVPDLLLPGSIRLDRRTGADWSTERRRAAGQTVTVVVLARAEASPLANALADAAAQTHAASEIIIALNDPTAAVRAAAERAANGAGTVTIVTAATRRSACRAAVAKARGEWIAFLAAGDRWRPDKLQIEIEAAFLSDADVLGCRTEPVMGAAGMPALFPPPGTPACSLRDMLARAHAVAGWSHTIMRRAALAACGWLDAPDSGDDDVELWQRLAAAPGVRTVRLWDRLVSSPVAFLTKLDAAGPA